MLERHALVVLLVADALVDEHLGDGGGQFAAVLAGDQVQHHVHGRGAAGRGIAVAVDGEQASADAGAGEGLLHGGQALPVHAAFEAVEQPGLGQGPAAGAHGAQLAALAGLHLQPVRMFAADAVLDVHAAADDHGVQGWSVVQAAVGGDLQAIAGADGAAVLAEGVPAVEFTTGEMVGHAQRFHRGRQGYQGEVVQQQETDGLGNTVLGLSPLVEL
ncbi:hypothetical protein D3C85_1076390 [compost metagenome]